MAHRDSRTCSSCGADIDDGPPRRYDDEPRGRRERSIAFEGPIARRDCAPHRGNTVLVLGIVSLTCIMLSLGIPVIPSLVGAPLGIAAWWMGQVDLRRMKAQAMDPSGKGVTQAGWICGIVGSILNALMVLFCAGCIGWMFYDIQQQSQQQTPPTFRTPGAPQKKF
jgi:hypothetical protein